MQVGDGFVQLLVDEAVDVVGLRSGVGEDGRVDRGRASRGCVARRVARVVGRRQRVAEVGEVVERADEVGEVVERADAVLAVVVRPRSDYFAFRFLLRAGSL